MKIALVQFDIEWAAPAHNRERLDGILSGLGAVDLIVLPEMFSTGFATKPEGIAEEAPCASLEWMKAKSSELGSAIAGTLQKSPYTIEMIVTPTALNRRFTYFGNYSSQGFGIENYYGNGGSDASKANGMFRFYNNNSPDIGTGMAADAGKAGAYSFVAAPTLQQYYKNGALAATTAKTLNTLASAGCNTIIGGELNRANFAFKGTFHAFRLYNRALTPAEVTVNANIDKIRFEYADPADLVWPEGWRWTDEKGLEARWTVDYDATRGTVELNGEPVAPGTETWLPLDGQTESVFIAKPLGTNAFGGWDVDSSLSPDATLTLKADGAHHVQAIFGLPSACVVTSGSECFLTDVSAGPQTRVEMGMALTAVETAQRRVEQQRVHAQDAVHRRADLVAHVLDELRLCLVGLTRFDTCLVECRHVAAKSLCRPALVNCIEQNDDSDDEERNCSY